MASSACIIRNTINFIHKFGTPSSIFPGLLRVQHYAARKSTREKARKKRVQIVAAKVTHAEKIKIIKNNKSHEIILPDMLRFHYEKKPTPIDDVYYRQYYTWKVYPFAEAISNHREYFHPTLYDNVETYVNIFVELNLKGVKKNKPIESFHKIVTMKHNFDHGEERKILAFCKSEDAAKLKDAGAFTVGGKELINQIMKGYVQINDYNTVISHTSLMAEVLSIRGLLKRKLPNLKSGTLGIDLLQIFNTQLYGINYTVTPYPDYPEYGYSTISIGKLNMGTEQLEENVKCVIDSIMSAKPNRPDNFISRIRIQCPNSKERFVINHNLYIKEEETHQKIDKAT